MSKEQAPAKLGQGHASAMLRAGAKEFSQILAAFPDSVQPVEEYGLFGTALPQEVFEEKRSMEANVEQNLEMEM